MSETGTSLSMDQTTSRIEDASPAGSDLALTLWLSLRSRVSDEVHVISSLCGSCTVRRRAGTALHPEREPLELLDLLRRSLGEYNFAGQYQQQPAPLGGALVKEEWFKSYAPGEEPATFERIVQSWDTANKSTELSDFSVCTTWGQKNKKLYLLHVCANAWNILP